MSPALRLLAATAALTLAPLPALAGKTLDAIKSRGQLACGVSTGVIGFSAADSQGQWKGLDVDVCKAIAAAVLGGCSLRGGQGTILGVIIAAAVIRLLRNSINLLGISTHLEYAIIGTVILCGVSADEIIKRVMAKRRAAK